MANPMDKVHEHYTDFYAAFDFPAGEWDSEVMWQFFKAGELFGNPEPVPVILHCPMCHNRHVDKDKYATRPHHTHACQECGHCWRPAILCTVGVQFLPGFKDSE